MAQNKNRKMSEEEVMPILARLFDQANAFKVNQGERYREAWQYYQGNYPAADKTLGSGAVVNITKPYVESVYQIANDIFFSSNDSVVRVKSDNVDAVVANEVSEALNTVTMNLNEITRKMQDAQKECLLQGFACMKVSLEEKLIGEKKVAFPIEDDSEGWTEEQLSLFIKGLESRGFNDIDVKIDSKKTKNKRPTKAEKEEASKIGKQLPKSYKVYSGNISAYARETKPAVDYVPFQEVFVHPHTRYTLDDAPYFCHSYKMSVADGVANGWDVDVINAAVSIGDEVVNDTDFTTTGLNTSKGSTYDPWTQSADGLVDHSSSSAFFRVYEHYWVGEYKGSIPKLWKIVTTDNEFLDEPEEMAFHPFVGMRCDLIPNSFFGNGIIDETKALQDQASYEVRLTNYTMKRAAIGRTWAIEGAVDKRSLLDERQGGVVIVKDSNAVGNMPVADISGALQLSSQRTEQRVKALSSGAVDGDDLSQQIQASGVALNLAINKQEQGPKSRALVMGQTGFVPLYQKVFLLLRQLGHPVRSGMDGYTMTDLPEDLGFAFDVSTLTDKQQDASNVINAMSTAINLNGGTRPSSITDENVYNAINNLMCASTGNKDNSPYITDPSTIQPTKEQIVMNAKQLQWTLEQGDAASQLANLKNGELLAKNHKEDADAAYTVAQMVGEKEKQEQQRITFALDVENKQLQNKILKQQFELNVNDDVRQNVETSVDVAQYGLNAGKQTFEMLTAA